MLEFFSPPKTSKPKTGVFCISINEVRQPHWRCLMLEMMTTTSISLLMMTMVMMFM